MARPRHAERRRAPLIATAVIVLVAVLVAAGLAVRFWIRPGTEAMIASAGRTDPASSTTSGSTTPGTTPGSTASADATDPASSAATAASTSATTARPSATGSTPSASAGSDDARTALENCVARVGSSDAVLRQAATGIHHWSMHVQAQTDADTGRISVARMNRTFATTKGEGQADLTRYRKAGDKQKKVGDACDQQPGASSDVAHQLASCRKRVAAQEPALKRAEAAMDDWRQHLSDMRRSASGEESAATAEQVWRNSYRTAPTHLRAYTKAAAALDKAPNCH